jgi:flavin reductase (DIM6/NTAB) family NADH-FMN oxidoreductase RutF
LISGTRLHDPPALLVCLHRSSSTFETVAKERRFSVNLLSAAQSDWAATFSSHEITGEQRFAEGAWAESPEGVPILRGTNATVLCDLESAMTFGTHAAVVGRVTDVQLGEGLEAAPLLYFDGAYRTLR